MSSNLEWKPVIRKRGNPLSDELKFAMRNRDQINDQVNDILNSVDVPYLEGLRDAGIKDAQKLIDAINKHKEIEVKEIF